MSANGKTEPLLRLSSVDTFYGPIHILQGITLEVESLCPIAFRDAHVSDQHRLPASCSCAYSDEKSPGKAYNLAYIFSMLICK